MVGTNIKIKDITNSYYNFFKCKRISNLPF